MHDFEKWWNNRSKFWKGIRTGDHDLSLEVLGYRRVYTGPMDTFASMPESALPDTSQNRAARRRGTMLGMISVGLINHSGRLNGAYWKQVQTWLEKEDPASPWIADALDDLLDEWRSWGIEARQSRGVWDLMNAASFGTWIDELIAATGQYRDACRELEGV